MDAKKFGVLWYYGEMSARILNGVTAQRMIEVIRICQFQKMII